MDEKVAKTLAKALQENTAALQDHAKLLRSLSGFKPQPRPQEPRIASRDPLTRFLGDGG